MSAMLYFQVIPHTLPCCHIILTYLRYSVVEKIPNYNVLLLKEDIKVLNTIYDPFVFKDLVGSCSGVVFSNRTSLFLHWILF